MKIFPLSPAGQAVLILIALALGIIWSMLQWPDFWRNLLNKNQRKQTRKQTKKKEK